MPSVAEKLINFKNQVIQSGAKLKLVSGGVFDDITLNDEGDFVYSSGEKLVLPDTGIDVGYTRVHFAGCTIMTDQDITQRQQKTDKKNIVSRHRPALVRFFKKDENCVGLGWSERGEGRPVIVSNLLAEIIAPYQYDTEKDEEVFVHKLTSCAFCIELPTPGGQSYLAEAAEGRSVSVKDFTWGVRNIQRELNVRLATMEPSLCRMLVGADAKERGELPQLGIRMINNDPRFKEPRMLDEAKGIADMFSVSADARIRVSDVRLFSVPTDWQLVQKGWLSHSESGRYLLTPKNRKHAMSRVPGTTFIRDET